MCNERVPGGQCICVHDERVCSSALSPETTRDGALKGWTGCEVLSSRVQDLHYVNTDNKCRTAGTQRTQKPACRQIFKKAVS